MKFRATEDQFDTLGAVVVNVTNITPTSVEITHSPVVDAGYYRAEIQNVNDSQWHAGNVKLDSDAEAGDSLIHHLITGLSPGSTYLPTLVVADYDFTADAVGVD